MIDMKMFFCRFVSFVLVSGIACSMVFAQKEYEKLFLKGNLADKNKAVAEAQSYGDGALALNALEFAVSARKILGEDSELAELCVTSVKSLSLGNSKGRESEVSSALCKVFREFSDERVRIAVIDAFSDFSSAEAVLLVNTYFNQRMENNEQMDEVLLKSVLFMGNYGNSYSFRLLFIADILDVWPTYSENLSNSYGVLADRHEGEILQILSTVPPERRIVILKKISLNKKISEKVRGIVAENALSSVIYNGKEVKSKFSREDVELMLLSLEVAASTKWTRASSVSRDCFEVLKSQYEDNQVSEESFSLAIRNLAAIGSQDIVQALSLYLDSLNKKAESNSLSSNAVVLSVIESLGELGDKSAFDYLLYVTYLDYPAEVTDAAKSALAKLKW